MRIREKIALLASCCGLRRQDRNDWLAIGLVGVLFMVVVFDLGMIFSEKYFNQENRENEKVEKITEDTFFESAEIFQKEEHQVIVTGWQIHRDNKRGFEIKYPENWIKEVVEGVPSFAWEQKIVFRENDPKKTKKEKGFNLFIYNTKKTGASPECTEQKGKMSQNIFPENRDCFRNESFLKMKNEEYVYEIIPVLPEEPIFKNNPNILITCDSREIINSMLGFKVVKIERPKPKRKPVITAPMPAWFKTVNGKKVCAKKNDKPGKSKKDKGRHLDMECCLDPDEYPNPHCTY